jgi:hypothetical protein
VSSRNPKNTFPSLSLSLSTSQFFGVWPTSSCPLGPMSTPDKLLTSSSRSPFLFNLLSGSNQKPQIRDLLLFSFKIKNTFFIYLFYSIFFFFCAVIIIHQRGGRDFLLLL